MSVTIEPSFEQVAESINEKIRTQLSQRAAKTTQILRNSELEILTGGRSGRMYGNHRASAPGEAPAVRSGALRRDWDEETIIGGDSVTAKITSNTGYAEYLENGTSRMSARPFVQRIKDKAEPEILDLMRQPYV